MVIFSPEKTAKYFSSLPPTMFAWVFAALFFFPDSSSSSPIPSPSQHLHPDLVASVVQLQNYTAMSDFRILNRRPLSDCPNLNPLITISVSPNSSFSNEQNVTVTVTGILKPDVGDWVAMISPATSSLSNCFLDGLMYVETGDLSNLPLLCHYPDKAQYLSNDPNYLTCSDPTCSASIWFHVINIRTEIEFVLFAGGFQTPCVLKRSNPINFTNPLMPLHGHLSSIDSTATSMRLTWVSGDQQTQQIQFEDGKSVVSNVSTFTRKDMCKPVIPNPAGDFGWHDPGFIHSAVMTGLRPSTNYFYKYGSDLAGWSDRIQFRTPPAGGSESLTFVAFGDMGKAPRDKSAEHYIQPGSISVIEAVADEVTSGEVDSVFHIGDISYATGFLVEWDYFLYQINPVASRVPYMTAIGNHERDFPGSTSLYQTPDSGGECGVPYETYFPMPSAGKDKPWYSIEQGSVHFTVMSTEHHWSVSSEQGEWIKKDMASVKRSKTPWLVFIGHRPMYSSVNGPLSVDEKFAPAVEPLLLENKVDLALFGHVHNYERTCPVYKGECKGMPTKDANGTDTYDSGNYTAPIHAIIGMAGFKLDSFPKQTEKWSLVRISEFGYTKIQATRDQLLFQYLNSATRRVMDSFRIMKKQK